MRNSIYLLLPLFVLQLMGCKGDGKTAEASRQMDQVMEIHDQVMPKMGTISKLVSELKSRIDSTEQGMACEKAMKELQASHDAMMAWMQGFGNRFDSEEILEGKALTPEKQQWLEEEEEKIREVREQINSSIAAAEELLGKQ